MRKQALNSAVWPRPRRNRVIAAGVLGVLMAATVATAGVMLANGAGAPMLTVVSDYNNAQTAPRLQQREDTRQPVADSLHEEARDRSDEAAEAIDDQFDDVRWFNDRPIRPVATMSMLVTAYSPDERSCGKWADGITASGYSVWTNGMKLVAADESILPFGSLVSIPGYDDGGVVPVLDRGGAIKGHRLDVLYATHERALQWGAQNLEVTVWEYADGKPNDFRQKH